MRGARQQPFPRDGPGACRASGCSATRYQGFRRGRTSRWRSSTPASARSAWRFYTAALNGIFGIENVLTIWLVRWLVLDTGWRRLFGRHAVRLRILVKTQFVQRTAALIEKGLEPRMFSACMPSALETSH